MEKSSTAKKIKDNVWKIAILAITISILGYLIFLTINDPRWIFTGIDGTLIVGILVGIMVIIYLLKFKSKNRKI